jgi:carboxyl-terminal processing protease
MKKQVWITIFILCSFLWSQEYLPKIPIETKEDLEKFAQSWQKTMEEHYYRAVSPDEFAHALIIGLRQVLADDYLEYKDAKEYQYAQHGKFRGIGLVLELNKDRLQVLSAIPGSPAAKSSIQPGDIVMQVNGENAQSKNMRELIDKLRQKKNIVVLQVHRPATKKQHRIDIVQQEFQVVQVFHQWKDQVAHIQIKSFPKNTAAKIQEICLDFQKKGAKGILLDLRGCYGGDLEEVLQVADGFLAQGTIANLKYRQETKVVSADNTIWMNVPMVILIDNKTTSGAEMLAASLKELGRAILVGTSTKGKGSIQKLFPLKKGALQVTIGHYFTPKGNNIQGVGVAPNIVVEKKEQQDTMGWELIQALMSIK